MAAGLPRAGEELVLGGEARASSSSVFALLPVLTLLVIFSISRFLTGILSCHLPVL